jgi:hypothetical protein
VLLEALSTRIPPQRIEAVLEAAGRRERRVRRLPAVAVVWLVIALGIWSEASIPTIWRRLVGTLRSLFLAIDRQPPPVKSAFSQARQRLGPAPLRRLFRQTAGPLADPQTIGAFYKGMRMNVIDGVHLDVPDTAANAAAFGRPSTRREGESVAGGYPQILVVYLNEAGTHGIQEALIRRATDGEQPAAHALLGQVAGGDLVLWDKGFYSYSLLADAMRRGLEIECPPTWCSSRCNTSATGRTWPRCMRTPTTVGRTAAACGSGSSNTPWTTRPVPGIANATGW